MLRCDAPEPTDRRPAELIGHGPDFVATRLTTAQHGMQDAKLALCLISFDRSCATLLALRVRIT
jgi:hypothetical protein